MKKTSKKTIKKLNNFNLCIKDGVIEYPQDGLKILDLIIKKINKLKGGMLLIDYGYLKKQKIDTLQSLKSHKKNVYYRNIEADITSLVNFQLCIPLSSKN